MKGGGIEAAALSFVGAFLTIGLAWLVDAIYFHFRYQKAIDRKVHESQNEPCAEIGLLLSIFRLGGYGVGLLFPSVAKRNGFHDVLQALPRNQRYHLIFLFMANVAMITSAVLAGAMIKFLNL